MLKNIKVLENELFSLANYVLVQREIFGNEIQDLFY